jgi:hypothetical protein
MPPRPTPGDRDELIAALRAIVNAPGHSGKHVVAKAQASRQLAQLLGLDAMSVRQQAVDEEQVPDPMADMDVMEAERRRRCRRR